MYVDLILCTMKGNTGGKPYLFQAPSFSRLKCGDDVICETQYGKKMCKVVGHVTINTESEKEAYALILKAAGATEPLKKVVTKVEYTELKYTED